MEALSPYPVRSGEGFSKTRHRGSMRLPSVRLVALIVCATAATALGQTKTWTVNADFDAGALTNPADAPADQVQLGGTRVSKNGIVWADNYYPSWVVKLDGATGRQLGRYDAALV